MPTITITINTDSAAFDDNPIPEIQRILAVVPAKLHRIINRKPGCVCVAPEADDKIQDSNGNTVGSLRVIKPVEQIQTVNLIIAPKQCERMMEKPDPMADGWCNQDTHSFSIYLTQEREAYEYLCKLIKQMDYRKLPALYRSAKEFCENFHRLGKMSQMDDDYEGGPINLREIIDQLVDEIRPTDHPSAGTKA